ncbi:uncharacterized protein Asciz [Prorops nasuta]|uniref:uncharacterized protein Asciz n=1 Tax=Prorops nasuta TaxID=863751 RepID=UPI0034CE02A1
MICPTAEELSVIINNIRCDKCGLIFRNEPRFKMHDLKVHQHKNLNKTVKENIRYHCPVQSCIYAPESERHFSTMKYLKQHYLKVHAEKAFPCNRCSKSFSTEAAKDAHMRICGIEFICSCTKSFNTSEALLTHAKRSLHAVDKRYKASSRRAVTKANQQSLSLNILVSKIDKPITILPIQNETVGSMWKMSQKTTYDVGVQTEEYKRNSKTFSPLKYNNTNSAYCNKHIESRQTQTYLSQKQTNFGRSRETQTTEPLHIIKESVKIPKRRKNCGKKNEYMLIKEDLALGENFTSSNLFPDCPLPLRHDVGLQDFWEKSSSGTQTLPEKDMYEVLSNNVTQTEFDTIYGQNSSPIQCIQKNVVPSINLDYTEESSGTVEGYSFTARNGISRSDPMLTEQTFDDKFSSIETQTEQNYSQSFFDPDPLSKSFTLSSNIETQTTENINNMEQLLYSNTYTQTCNEIFAPDLGISNIQTQTAWTTLEDTTVSTETQTKELMCQTDCNISMGICRSWLNTQISHTETQTDLLNIFEELQ